MNSFFASCEQQDDPSLRGKPIAVVPMLNVESTSILAASYEAKHFGIKTGTRVAEARRLCPRIQVVKTHHDRYLHYHDRIAEAIESVLPIDQVLSIDEYGCRLTGSQQNCAQAIAIAHAIKNKIETTVGECLTTSIGISSNLTLAKVASDLQKPNGLVVIDEENRDEILRPLSVRVIPGVGSKMEQRLNHRGYYTLNDLLSASLPELRSVWGGVVGERYYHWIRGQDIKRPYTENRSLGHQHVLEPEFRNRESGILILKKLLVRAAARLRKNGFYAKHMHVSVAFMRQDGVLGTKDSMDGGMEVEEEGQRSHQHDWGASRRFQETHDPIELLVYLDEIVKNFPWGKRPLRVGVSFSDLVDATRHQFSFFEDPKREELLSSMDRLNKKYGREALTFASLKDLKTAGSSKIAFNHIPDSDEV